MIANPDIVILENTTRLSATISPPGIYDVIFLEGTNFLGTASSDINGLAQFDWLVPASTSIGSHDVTIQIITPISCQNTIKVYVNPETVNTGIILLMSATIGGFMYFSKLEI